MRMSEVSYTMDLQKPLWTKAAHLRDTGMAMEFITVKQLFTTDSKKKKNNLTSTLGSILVPQHGFLL